jgi:hypothetical protein
MSLRRGKHAPKRPHRRLTRVCASGASGYQRHGGER